MACMRREYGVNCNDQSIGNIDNYRSDGPRPWVGSADGAPFDVRVGKSYCRLKGPCGRL
jgi:hypothetical protein